MFYEVYIHCEEFYQFSFITIHPVEIPNNIVEQLILDLVGNSIPQGLALQRLRQGITKLDQYEMKNTNHYLQDYLDTIIERIDAVYSIFHILKTLTAFHHIYHSNSTEYFFFKADVTRFEFKIWLIISEFFELKIFLFGMIFN